MAERTSRSRQQTPEGLPETWAKDLTDQFRRVLSTKRMNALSQRPAGVRSSSQAPELQVRESSVPPPSRSPIPRYGYEQHSIPPPPPTRAAPPVPSPMQTPVQPQTIPPPPPYAALRNIPLVPAPPTDRRSMQFRHMLHSLSQIPVRWENPGLLDEALRAVPLEQIYNEAQEESDLYEAEAASLGKKAAWGYQDCVVRALMRWFKRSFFQWVNNPPCGACRAPTIARGMAAPLPDEQARGANRVELYQCSNGHCRSFERFARYNDAFVLLQTRKGRVGEWANCFTMLCRAVGSRVRWVWNSEDHVWTEVWSVHRKRWVHVDVCEEVWDQPLLYTHGWKRKIAYCIAFAADGVTDVTRRYVRNPAEHGLPRTRCPENVLLHILDEIRSQRRRDMNKPDKFRLEGEDMKEDREFRNYIIESLIKQINLIAPGTSSSRRPDPDAQKAAEERERDAQWLRTRSGETRGSQHPRDQQ